LSTDALEAAQAAFDVLQDWWNEILAVNEPYLTNTPRSADEMLIERSAK
jgi:hypothetical protein